MFKLGQKIIFLEDRHTTRSQILTNSHALDTLGILDISALPTKCLFPQPSNIEFYNALTNQYEKLPGSQEGKCRIDPIFICQYIFIFRLDFIDQEAEDDYESYQISSKQPYAKDIKARDRSRTIAEIISYVRLWRNLVTKGEKGKSFNYQQAADAIGVPKKSLDDYYYQLRVGEKYDFNFANNMNSNIKTLRNFVKSQAPSRNKKNKYDDKLPKVLKLLEENTPELKEEPSAPKEAEAPVKQEESQAIINSYYSRKNSESNFSSLGPIWLSNNPQHNILSGDDDSFFKHFKNPMENQEEYEMFNDYID